MKVAAQSILKNKMRAMLTMLGIVIGVGAVIVMVAVGNGAQKQVEGAIGGLGTNLLMIMPGSATPGALSCRPSPPSWRPSRSSRSPRAAGTPSWPHERWRNRSRAASSPATW
jgi:ABC-type lipoprotein release transport system permease subunit